MSYTGTAGAPPTPLTELADRFEDLIDPAARAYVDDAVDLDHHTVKENTPVSKTPEGDALFGFIPRGDGVHLRDEIHRTDVRQEGDIYEADVESDKDYAPFVEEGTGLYGPKHAKYLIEPHDPTGWLAWPGEDGKTHFAKQVWHPGSPGQHMFAIGSAVVEMSEHEWRRRGDQILIEGMR